MMGVSVVILHKGGCGEAKQMTTTGLADSGFFFVVVVALAGLGAFGG